MPKMKAFEFLEHTADIYVAAHGKTLEEAFGNAALAMFEAMTDTKTVEPKILDILEVKAVDEYALLYSWLEELLIKFEVEERLYSKFIVEKIEKTSKSLILKAKAFGEFYNPEKHPSKVGIKAVTYHLMEIVKNKERVTIKFLLDV